VRETEFRHQTYGERFGPAPRHSLYRMDQALYYIISTIVSPSIMSKKSTRMLDTFFVVKSVMEQYSAFQEALKTLYKNRLIDRLTWNLEIVPAENSLSQGIDRALDELYRRAVKRGFPHELVREDEVTERLGISRKTIYRRRKKREIAYIKDKDGIIWYSVLDLIDYLRESKAPSLQLRSGRPRKF